MITAAIKSRINFPKISLVSDLEKIAKNIVIPDIIKGIDKKVAIMGGPLPKNAPATVKRKGHSRPLIDTGTLRKSFKYKRTSSYSVIISISSDRKKIGAYLQSGIKARSGLKKYLFFGISKDASRKAMLYMQKRIGEIIKRG